MEACNDRESGTGDAVAVIAFPESDPGTPPWVQASLFDEVAARLLVGASGEVHWASKQAAILVDRSASLRLDKGRLVGANRRVQSKLDALLEEAAMCGKKIEALLAPEAEDGPVLFIAARNSAGPDGESLMLVLREVARDTIQIPDLIRLFGLTRAEQQVVSMLINGMSVAGIARTQNNSELTVRTHLKRSYSKINVRTKEQLFARLLRLMTD